MEAAKNKYGNNGGVWFSLRSRSGRREEGAGIQKKPMCLINLG